MPRLRVFQGEARFNIAKGFPNHSDHMYPVQTLTKKRMRRVCASKTRQESQRCMRAGRGEMSCRHGPPDAVTRGGRGHSGHARGRGRTRWAEGIRVGDAMLQDSVTDSRLSLARGTVHASWSVTKRALMLEHARAPPRPRRRRRPLGAASWRRRPAQNDRAKRQTNCFPYARRRRKTKHTKCGGAAETAPTFGGGDIQRRALGGSSCRRRHQMQEERGSTGGPK